MPPFVRRLPILASILGVLIAGLVVACLSASALQGPARSVMLVDAGARRTASGEASMAQEKAILAGGCFWCTEAIFTELRGVESVTSGYIGGRRENPTYEQVCSGATGHAEAVEVVFDPAVIPYRDLLGVFFATHDPTTPNRQGADEGTQYRSAIFPLSPEQERTARAFIQELTAEGIFEAPIVTTIEPAAPFYPAEGYHQDYFAKNPQQPYCAAVVGPKVAKFRAHFLELLR